MFGGKNIKVLADRDYEDGDEVFISYGLKSSAECLEDHGIVPELIAEDFSCELIMSMEKSDRFSGDKFNVLEQELLSPVLQIDLETDSEMEIGK
jgi:hypothetical protein